MNEQNKINAATAGAPSAAAEMKKPGAIGAHPVGATLGAVGTGAVAGAVGGAVAGPVGAVAGAAAGAVVGAFAGGAVSEAINPAAEGEYWKANYSSRPYARPSIGYDDFAPAYKFGWESYGRRGAQEPAFDRVETELGRGWEQAKGASRLTWAQAREATRDAWTRVQHASKKAVSKAEPAPVTTAT